VRVEVDWDGDGKNVGVFEVTKGAMVLPDGSAAGMGYIPFTVRCPHGVVEVVCYSPAFAETPGCFEAAAVDGACNACGESP
jgi:hypothetical protein